MFIHIESLYFWQKTNICTYSENLKVKNCNIFYLLETKIFDFEFFLVVILIRYKQIQTKLGLSEDKIVF